MRKGDSRQLAGGSWQRTGARRLVANWAARKSERLQGGRCSQRCEGAEALTAGRRRSREGGIGRLGDREKEQRAACSWQPEKRERETGGSGNREKGQRAVCSRRQAECGEGEEA